jgi:hypothetical protein
VWVHARAFWVAPQPPWVATHCLDGFCKHERAYGRLLCMCEVADGVVHAKDATCVEQQLMDSTLLRFCACKCCCCVPVRVYQKELQLGPSCTS